MLDAGAVEVLNWRDVECAPRRAVRSWGVMVLSAKSARRVEEGLETSGRRLEGEARVASYSPVNQ